MCNFAFLHNMYILISYVYSVRSHCVMLLHAYVCMYIGINNTCFMCGKAEDVLLNLLSTQKVITSHVIGLVDLPYMSWTALVVASTTMLV